MKPLLLLLAAVVIGEQDWPEFRGPTAQGHSPEVGLPTEWSQRKNVAWKQPIPGHGWSSPAIHRGRVYLTSAIPAEGTKDQLLSALCLDAKSGEVIWNQEIFRQNAAAPPIHVRNSHASPTAIVDAGRVFVHFGLHGTACLDLDGKVVWRVESPSFDHEDGNGNSPLLVDEALIVNYDGKDKAFIRAMDRATGKVLWHRERKSKAKNSYSYSTPLLITVKDRRQVISPGSGTVWSYDPKTGEEIWKVDYGDGYSVVPRPVLGHGLLFICTGFDKPSLLAIRPDGAGDVTRTHVAWSTNKGVPLIASLLLVGDELYMVSDVGVASCWDARTGKEHWRERLGGQHWSSPVFADGKVYFQNVDGIGFVLKAGTTYELIAQNPLGEKTHASYAVSDGALFIRTQKQLYRIQRSP